ncbi:GntR family transcriptional regulator [Inhella gelatinilytica]|uniref:GntR family transcriptional regulator n=1 Tax=Inhella gelatinilytica TaxID=2795030 RepID=A0A931IVN5_9BURK|nr:GntR family transcriptional regulator [Inhella gelatinilytica]MBH9553642.1 GntR family transcriptional regulator [Inhella gelatinilytica]
MGDTLPFLIHTGSTEPIYRQLMDQVRRRVAAGQWQAGQELPSVRELAAALAVNPMTISKAYSLLEAEGLLERRRGLGMVIAAGHTGAAPKAERIEALRPTLERAAAEARELAVPTEQVLTLLRQLLEEGKSS